MSGHLPLDGQVALITGSTQGIGYGIAQRFLEAGARVGIVSRDEEHVNAAISQLAKISPEVCGSVASVRDDAASDACVADVLARWGKIDILVNNVGANLHNGPLLTLEARKASAMFDINVWSAVAWTRRVWEASMNVRGGAVVNIGSVAARAISPGAGFYGATKAMLAYVTRVLARELAPHVRVNCIEPGVVSTGFAAALGDRMAEMESGVPLKRWGEPQDVAEAALYLVSPASAWVTGSTLLVDGGTVA